MTTISKKNFSGTDIASIPKADVYELCNFRRLSPNTAGPDPVGQRLFPGDDTPRTFRQCNLINCEVPPGSVIENCNTAIVDYDLPDVVDTITVNGTTVSTRQRFKNRIYGRFNPVTGNYEYKPTPEDIPE